MTTNKFYTFRGKSLSLTRWAAIVGINLRTLNSRIFKYGWAIEEALTTPVRGYKGGAL